MTSFESFIKGQKSNDDFTKRILSHLDNESGYTADPDMYRPKRDASGIYNGLIRFLPQQDENKAPWVQLIKFDLQLPKGKFSETSLRTYGQPCPVWEYYQKIRKENPDRAERFKPWTSHVVNIVVLRDKNDPATVGKVYKYSFGWGILQMIKEKLKPSDIDDQNVNIFSMFTGADFELKIKTKQYKDLKTGKEMKSPDYTLSTFRSPSVLFDGDEAKLRAVYNSLFDLDEYTKPANIMSYNEMESKFFGLLGKTQVSVVDDIDEIPEFGVEDLDDNITIKPQTKTYDEPKAPARKLKPSKPIVEVEDDEDDELSSLGGDSLDNLLSDLGSPEPMKNVKAKEPAQKSKPVAKTLDINEEFDFDSLDSLDLE